MLISRIPTRGHEGKTWQRPHKLMDDQVMEVINHIKSFKGRQSHYSRNRSRRLYLPDTLNISKMHALFREQRPASSISYETYRSIFNSKFNISFEYPRSDTCSKCDEFAAKINHLEAQLLNEANAAIDDSLWKLKVE